VNYDKEVFGNTEGRPQNNVNIKSDVEEVFVEVPEFTRREIPNVREDSELNASLNHLWITKKEIEEDMQAALEDGDEVTYRDHEALHNKLN
jgi:hypothetical protein